MRRSAPRAIGYLVLLLGLLSTGSASAATSSKGQLPGGLASGQAAVRAAINYDALHAGQSALLAVVVDIPEGLHAQSHAPLDENLIALEITLQPAAQAEYGTPLYPPGRIEDLSQLGRVSIYTGQVVVYVPVEVKQTASAGGLNVAGSVRYQLCNDSSCFVPRTDSFELHTRIVPPQQALAAVEPELFAGYGAQASSSSSASSAAPLHVLGWDITSHVYFFAFIAAFVAGIIFNVMPCVLPVVPLKAIGFYEVSQHHRGKSLALGLVFSAGLVSAFGVLAVLVVGLRVLDWGELFTKPWFIIPLVVILIVMGFSLFGAFTVLVPTALYRITPRHDTYSGNFLFGILTAALSTPCTFGLFVVVLAWALKQPPAWGVALVMTVGAGMAFPYLVLSALPELARRLPRTGPWSEMVKQLLGFLLIATAIYFARPLLDRALPPQSFWWAIFACVAGACLFLVVRTYQLKVGAMPRAIAVVVALLIIVPALYATRLLTIRPYQWTPYSDAALTTARSTGRPVLVEFTADWCGNCHYLEAFVLHKPRIVQAVNDHGVVMLKADVTAEHAPGKALLAKLSTAGAIPLTAIYPPGATQPILLTGIYSQSDLRNAIEQAVQTPVSTGGVVAAGPHR